MKYIQPRVVSFVAWMAAPVSSCFLAWGSAASSAAAVTSHAVAGQRRGDALPVRVDEHAAGVQEDRLDHRPMINGTSLGTVAATSRTQPSGSSIIG